MAEFHLFFNIHRKLYFIELPWCLELPGKKERKMNGKAVNIWWVVTSFLHGWWEFWFIIRFLFFEWSFRYHLGRSVGLWCRRYSHFGQEGEGSVWQFLLTLVQMPLWPLLSYHWRYWFAFINPFLSKPVSNGS
jgi:hypothetical protein